VGLAGAWYGTVNARLKTDAAYKRYVAAAEESREKGLYEQAVENFKHALSIKGGRDLWLKIRDTYEEYSAAIPTAEVKNAYAKDMLAAAGEYTKDTEFYLSALLRQMEDERYRDAKRTSDLALKNGAVNDEIRDIASRLTYMTKLDYKLWTSFSSALNGYYAVSDGASGVVIDNKGDEISDRYEDVGPVSADGWTAVKTARGFRLIDGNGVERAVLPKDISASGVYDADTGLLPLSLDGKWQYFSIGEDSLLPAKYDSASAYAEGRAAVATGGKWRLIDAAGETVTELPFDEVRPALDGGYTHSGICIAKQGGKWHLFDEKHKQRGDLSAEDIDVFNGGYIAFKDKGKWGFADAEGSVVKKPEYSEAKSFANGLAAVKNEEGLWGFVDEAFALVIPYQYRDADYFNADRACFVSEGEGMYQRLGFLLD
jgi:hypothetical protein